MLVRLLYASRAAVQLDAEELGTILRQARQHNPAQGITGALCFSDGTFLQLIEGGRSAVNALFQRISRDPRHTDVLLLHYTEISERRFANWTMGQVQLSRVNPALLLKYSEGTSLDPYALSGPAMLRLFEEWLGCAAIVGQG
ncbi:blue-light sensor BLUF [Vitreoscilla filiformis]|jgi:Sensors of blue-light using FAD|uniref:Blue-light sensor BLUF n=1 Tax=Vitreoscilla filiformis TaxID=63 RepID=A0A221KBY8_VITFI|nr:BLUF domain-containing protein [Vitreoscilla filiformis]ASM76347.1 blue-light sensor BLUF [Vitreoscilla filiformis]